MRVLGPALAGFLALSAQTGAHAELPGPSVRGAGNSSGWHAAPGEAGPWRHGWTSPHWRPNRQYGGWGPYGGPPVPSYWVWGPRGGAFDYPFADWRGPTGGWGNP